ncbi:cell surface A33 antigen-like isoform X3 [Kryptolebias marmoratus]|uniref:cell surface A33 antigen-like isoform X3 n=1 Tax=Kryptolebias marmoratus TaxID=37003 RepID=UPI0018ACA5BD|nr:cell surface A33 antigen-like isoform X3 [Kryptolebias marmoratus]
MKKEGSVLVLFCVGGFCSGSVLVLFCVVWSGVAAMDVNIPQKVYEFARYDNIMLPCTFTSSVTNPPLVIITWTALAQAGSDALDTIILSHYHPAGKTDVDPDYKGRASLNLDMKTGRADLKLNSITLKDNREFECAVQIPGDATGQTADKTRLVVQVGPSPPICQLQGLPEYGRNIRLTLGGVLSLYNVGMHTSGNYICTSRNKISSASCNLTLKVMPPSVDIVSALRKEVGAFLKIAGSIIGGEED